MPVSFEEKLRKRSTPPYWWPETNTMMQLFLALSIVLMVGYILTQLFGGQALKIDPSVRDLVVFIMGIVFGNFKDVYGYTFGSSAGAKKQGEAITESLKKKDEIIASGTGAGIAAATAAAAPEAARAAVAEALSDLVSPDVVKPKVKDDK